MESTFVARRDAAAEYGDWRAPDDGGGASSPPLDDALPAERDRTRSNLETCSASDGTLLLPPDADEAETNDRGRLRS